MKKVEEEIIELIHDYENPRRVAISKKYPILKKPAIFLRHQIRAGQNFLDIKVKYQRSSIFFNHIIARHQSVLRRRLGNSSPKLQEQKIINLKQALKQLNGVVIKPGHIFSLWRIIGKPKSSRGYVKGMLISNGQVVEGLGGGLCQLSNFLYWIFLHAPIRTIERYHHSLDVFPDSGRVLPFGGGATVLYNFIDLKIKNISDQPLQLKLWLTDNHLKGQILSPQIIPLKFHILEKNHYIIKRGQKHFRYNEIYRETIVAGRVVKTERITANFAPIVYKVTDEYLKRNNFQVLDFTDRR